MKSFENPLVPNRTLRALWVAMAQLRLLDRQLHQIDQRSRLGRKYGPPPAAAQRAADGGDSTSADAKANPTSFLDEVACRVTTATHLAARDLISDTRPPYATDLLWTRPLAEILHSHYVSAVRQHPRLNQSRSTARGRNRQAAPSQFDPIPANKTPGRSPGHLPQTASALSRLHLAIGAAAALKSSSSTATSAKKSIKPYQSGRSLQPGRIVLAYVIASELTTEAWQQIFALPTLASLPLLLVALPDPHLPDPPEPSLHEPHLHQPHPQRTGKLQLRTSAYTKPAQPPHSLAPGTLSQLACQNRIPGILVDSDDAIALYRVATESFGRIRSGDGAVLIECHRLPASSQPAAALDNLRRALLARSLVTPAWFDRIERTFQLKLQAADE